MAPPPLPQPMRPTFHPAAALFRLRPSDFGFLQMAEFLPADFSLVLASPLYSLTVGSKAICNVITSCLFTDSIQANIKFSIKNHHSKEAVLFFKEDCRVSPDLKTFQLAFPLHQPGTYLHPQRPSVRAAYSRLSTKFCRSTARLSRASFPLLYSLGPCAKATGLLPHPLSTSF